MRPETGYWISWALSVLFIGLALVTFLECSGCATYKSGIGAYKPTPGFCITKECLNRRAQSFGGI